MSDRSKRNTPEAEQRRLSDHEDAMARQEALALEREAALIKQERAYIGHRMALGDRARSLAEAVERIHHRANSLGDRARSVSALTVPRPDPFAGDRAHSYEELEVVPDARASALRLRERAVSRRLEVVDSRKRTLEREAQALTHREEVYALRERQIRRMEEALEALEADATIDAAALARSLSEELDPEGSLGSIPQMTPVSDDDDERRGEPRYGLKVYVGLESEHNFYTGYTRNISAGGIFIATQDPLPVGSDVELLFQLPTGAPVHTVGQVTWTRQHDPANPRQFPGMGVKFVDLAPADAEKIRLFLERRRPLLHEDE